MAKLSDTKITEEVAKSAAPATGPNGERVDKFIWDRELRGFGLRVKRSGSTKTWILSYRRGSRQRRYAFGKWPALKAAEARGIARGLLARIQDPRETFDPAEQRAEERRHATVAARIEEFLGAPALVRRRGANEQRPRAPRTIAEYRALFTRFVIPAIGSIRIPQVTDRDVRKVFDGLASTPRQANHLRAALSAFFSWALPAGTHNPARSLPRHAERRHERYLTSDEFGRLGRVLAEAARSRSETESALSAIALLIFTGCRRGEILTLRWEHVDKDNACLRLPTSKTGAKVIRLNEPALRILERIKPKERNPHVIWSPRRDGEHLDDLERPWRRIRDAAQIKDVRLHDLRHSFASVAITGGLPLAMIGGLLGHRQAQTTERYAHLATDAVHAAAESVGAAIAKAMRKRPRKSQGVEK